MKLTHQLTKPATEVIEQLSKMRNFVNVHPVIYKIESVGENEYKAYERLTFLSIPVKFNYTFTVNLKKNIITFNANVKNMTQIEMRFEVAVDGSGCIVNETVDFNTTLPIKGTMEKIFKKQHNQLFLNIEKL